MNRRTFTDLQIVIHSYVILRVICGKHSFFICKIPNINNSMYNWFTLKHFNMKLSVSSLKKYFARNKIVFLHLWFLTKYNLITIMNWWHWWGIYSQYFKEFFFYFQRQTFLKLKNTVNSFYNICIKTWLILWYKLLNRHIL